MERKSQKTVSTYIIAEMACSHDGNPSLAYKIIDGAGQAGANAIQFQIWKLSEMMVPHHPDFERVLKIELSREQWADLATYVQERYPDMQIIACVYERSTVDFCEKLGINAYKLHSADLSNPYLVKYVAATKKRIDLSVGASTIDEIATAIEWIRETSDSEIWMMYGYQNFPTPTDEIHLRYMMKLKRLFELPLGYQDHSDGNSETAFWLPATALGMGVDILEKHITHDRALKGIDHEAALNPDEFARFVEMVRILEGAMGVSIPHSFSDEELKYRKYSKKSLVATHDLPINHIITKKDLTFMRAENLGLPPDQNWRLLGKTTRREITKLHLIQEEDVI
ncbi:MAG: N-acetylneuraminate synthase family protein [Anaerolineae bacterium]|nr:N-acetylneuraminate synthase family protein [Anaerolineae bacterium]